ncbi:MAG: HAD family hydrolase [Deltaproteobacteria bacterium]
MIKAVIFDMDGVMIDSEPLWEKTERILLGRRGIDYNPSYRDKIVGLNQQDSGALLVRTFNLPETVDDIIGERIAILLGIYETELRLMDGLIRLLEELRDGGMSLAVASSSPNRVIKFVLEKFNLGGFFDTVVAGEFVPNGKPHPDIYLYTARKLSAEPEECAVIEDSINGLRAAKSAGMRCIAAPDKRLSQAEFAAADIIVPSVSEINLNLVLSLAQHG